MSNKTIIITIHGVVGEEKFSILRMGMEWIALELQKPECDNMFKSSVSDTSWEKTLYMSLVPGESSLDQERIDMCVDKTQQYIGLFTCKYVTDTNNFSNWQSYDNFPSNAHGIVLRYVENSENDYNAVFSFFATNIQSYAKGFKKGSSGLLVFSNTYKAILKFSPKFWEVRKKKNTGGGGC